MSVESEANALEYEVPAVKEMEDKLIGAMVNFDYVIAPVVAVLGNGNGFIQKSHRECFDLIVEMHSQGLPIDLVTVTERIQHKGKENAIRLMDVSRWSASAASGANAEYYATIVKQRFTRRALIHMLGKMTEQAKDKTVDTDSIISYINDAVFHLAEPIGNAGPEHIEDNVGNVLASIGKRERGISSGFPELDLIIPGFQSGSYNTIAARTGVGKTTFALELALNMALNKDNPQSIAIFSLEMTGFENVSRLLAYYSGVNEENLTLGNLTAPQLEKVTGTASKLAQLPIFIDEDPSLTPNDMFFRVRQLQHSEEIGAVFIDYLQLMNPDSKGKSRQRHEEVSNMSRSIKESAKRLGVPIFVLAQLSRATEQRDDKRPQLQDLRESGAIEQDSDRVIFLYRPDFSGAVLDADDEGEMSSDRAEIIVAKQRAGKTGTAEIRWNDDLAVFQSVDKYTQYMRGEVK